MRGPELFPGLVAKGLMFARLGVGDIFPLRLLGGCLLGVLVFLVCLRVERFKNFWED